MDLWTIRDRPVLNAIVFVDKRDQRAVRNLAELVELTGLSGHQVQRSVVQLEADGLVAGARHKGLDGGVDYARLQPTPEGYRRAGEWPSGELARELLRVLEVAAREADSEDERHALTEATRTLRRVAEQTLANVAATLIAGQVGSG